MTREGLSSLSDRGNLHDIIQLGITEMGLTENEEPQLKYTTEYAVFNDPEFWEPLFASGEIPASERYQLDQPLHTGTSLWLVYRWTALNNEARADHGKADKYGMLIIKKRVVVETTWEGTSAEEIDEVRR